MIIKISNYRKVRCSTKQSELKGWAAAEAAEQRQDKPVLGRTMNLLFWVANEVPDDIFEVALTPPGRSSLFELTFAFHWREKGARPVIEGWAVRDVGTRIEHRSESGKLLMLIVETPRWRFTWRPTRNDVTVQPSRLKHSDGYSLISPNVRAREDIVRGNEAITAIFSSRRERLGGREVERLFVHLPADPRLNYSANLHHADPKILRASPLPTVFYSRRYWFDPKTSLIVARQCGCKDSPAATSAYEPAITIDYPQPASLPRDLFTFQIPASATLTVIDPELGRPLQSQGQSKSAERR